MRTVNSEKVSYQGYHDGKYHLRFLGTDDVFMTSNVKLADTSTGNTIFLEIAVDGTPSVHYSLSSTRKILTGQNSVSQILWY